jgi:peptidoglycan/LPS O-acetylase OafA/YrhL
MRRRWLGEKGARGPIGGKPGEIRALDGVRALAALSVLFYHSYGHAFPSRKVVLGRDITLPWDFMQTGVHLFFVLSGFLLFLPYARAMLAGRPLPSARRFYGRRALRILPAYWACLLALVLVHWPRFASPLGLADVGAHAALLQDDFFDFNRAIAGPFWTLAVEAQFYLVLPLFAAGVALVVGRSRSLVRLVAGVLLVLGGALLLREVDAVGQRHLADLRGAPARALLLALRATMGMQGKFLEVFAVGMLCGVLYIAVVEERRVRPAVAAGLGLALLAAAAAGFVVLGPLVHEQGIEVPPFDVVAQPGNPLAFYGPLLIGLAYGALVLAVLWGGGPLRALCESGPLVFVGAMSYSLYLWHLPLVFGEVPPLGAIPIAWRVATAFAVAYLSYRLVELPFMRRRAGDAATRPRPAAAGAPPASQPARAEPAERGFAANAS